MNDIVNHAMRGSCPLQDIMGPIIIWNITMLTTFPSIMISMVVVVDIIIVTMTVREEMVMAVVSGSWHRMFPMIGKQIQ